MRLKALDTSEKSSISVSNGRAVAVSGGLGLSDSMAEAGKQNAESGSANGLASDAGNGLQLGVNFRRNGERQTGAFICCHTATIRQHKNLVKM